MTRPVVPSVAFDAIPDELRRQRRWVMWRYIDRDGRWTKIPFQRSGVPARSDDPSTWCGFHEVVGALRFDGIGFVLGDGWAGIDVDGYLGNECNLVENIPGYRELSPGLKGIKVIGRSARIGGEINFKTIPPSFTRWDGARYFTITGQSARGDPRATLTPFLDEWFPRHIATSIKCGWRLAGESSDDDILMAAVANETTGDDFLSLWRGELGAYGNDHSRADLALCGHLAFWTNYDAARIDRLFRLSNLYRDKWDQPSYRRATIGKVLR